MNALDWKALMKACQSIDESEKRLLVRIDFVTIPRIKVGYRVKAVAQLEAIHEAQLLTYMKLTQCRVGLLINFNDPTIKQGLKRMAL